jgi:hypothetical protein
VSIGKSSWLIFVVPLLVQLPLRAQSDARSTILGRVTDTAGGVIASASVKAENTATGVHSTAVTNASGDYLLPFLIPGPYSLTVEAPGFKRVVRPQVEVRFEERITIDVTLEIGAVSETVQVSAQTPLMDSSTVSMGQVLSNKTVVETPLIAGNATVMASYSPGVLFLPTFPKDVRPFDTGSGSAIAGDGTLLGTAQFLLDGAANNELVDKGFSYEPPQGAIQEVKVQTASFDASYGYWTGVTLNVSLKSGANALHGQGYYFNQNPAVDANQFFANQFGSAKYEYKAHRWGGVLTGPVYIPKLYDGRNKTFFMYGYEGMWTFDPVSIGFESEPTPAQRTGNFSDLLALGPKYQIYDPYSTIPAAGGLFQRTPLPNNIIPPSQINPVGAAIIQLYDLPNRAGTSDGTNNYTNGRNSHDKFYNHIVRIDQNVSDKQRFFVRVDGTSNQRKQDQRHHDALGHLMYRKNQPGAAIDHVYTVSPQFFINTRYSYTRYLNPTTPNQLGWDLAGMGFSSSFINQINAQGAGYLRLPQIAASNGLATGAGGYSALSIQTNIFNPGMTHDLAANATRIAGVHTLRFGLGYRIYQNNVTSLGNSSGLFAFGSTWVNGPLSTSAVAPAGQGMASLLYGLPTSGSFSTFASNFAEETKTFSTYIQDDWKVSRRLTLSLGLRYELPTPMTERFNRSVLGYDATVPSPVAAAAQANYAANPIPQIAPSQFQVLGGLTFPGVNGHPRTLWNTNYTNLMPRFGFAYSITPDTIVRGGYGIYFEPLGTPAFDVNQTGFSATTQMVVSTDNGQHYIANIANPFPNGLTPPLGAAGGLSTNLGQSLTINNQNLKTPYAQRWQLALQRSLPANSVLEVSYVGNRGVRQLVSKNLDALPDQYLSTSPVRDQATINLLSAQVPNPFYPLLPNSSLSGTTVARSQLLMPYPQFTGISMNTNQGYSWYHGMQTRFEKRFSAGFQSSVSWTWSKLMSATGYLNPGDIMPEKVISAQDRTQRVVVTGVYELPFGRNKPLGQSWGFATRIVSGWQISGLFQHQTGAALGFGDAILTGTLQDIPLPADKRTVTQWFNVNAFVTNSATQLGSHLRVLSSLFSGIRQDGQNNLDAMLSRTFTLERGFQLQFRTDWFNALNHPQFLAPNTSPTSSAFGQVTGTWSSPRTIQFALKLLY